MSDDAIADPSADAPPDAVVRVPGSKSITQPRRCCSRRSPTDARCSSGALFSDDTRYMSGGAARARRRGRGRRGGGAPHRRRRRRHAGRRRRRALRRQRRHGDALPRRGALPRHTAAIASTAAPRMRERPIRISSTRCGGSGPTSPPADAAPAPPVVVDRAGSAADRAELAASALEPVSSPALHGRRPTRLRDVDDRADAARSSPSRTST